MAAPKGHKRYGGRKKGTPNKINADVREMIVGALGEAGGQSYLVRQAKKNPNGFMALVGKTLPKEIKAELFVSLSQRMKDILARPS